MLNFEPVTIGPAGYPELGQSGEGLWDAQHAHQFLHQAMLAVHPLAGLDDRHPRSMMEEGRFDLSLFGGQGSATIGRPSSCTARRTPGRRCRASITRGRTRTRPRPSWARRCASIRRARGVRVQRPRAHAARQPLLPAPRRAVLVRGPRAARVRRRGRGAGVGRAARRQGSGEPDATQLSASVYAWGSAHDWRFDALADWAIDSPTATRARRPRSSSSRRARRTAARRCGRASNSTNAKSRRGSGAS